MTKMICQYLAFQRQIHGSTWVLGAFALALSTLVGCSDETPAPAATTPVGDPPAVYMKDPAFRKALEEKRADRAKLDKVRAELSRELTRLADEARAKLPGADDATVQAELEKNPEWNSLVARFKDVNQAYDDSRAATLKTVRERLAPQKPISK